MSIFTGNHATTLLRAFLAVGRQRVHGRDQLGRTRPLALLPLDTGGCEGCAMEVSVLGGSAFALEQRGFLLVSEPEDADWLLVTGPVTRGCAEALERNWRAMPPGRSLVAIGDCAINGGPFGPGYAVFGGLEALTPVQMRLPGCPPSPDDILAGLEKLARG